jgi:RimJ/RimL family protein N-acetyltransferase
LTLRCWWPDDAARLKQAVDENREYLKPWMPWAHGDPEPLDAVVQWLRTVRGRFDLDQDFGYAILNRDESLVLGSCGLHTRLGEGARMIGYWIHQAHAGQGLATEAAAALTRVAFEVDGVNRVEIHCDPRNLASAAIPRKLGYTYEATLRQRRDFHGQLLDSMIWTLLAGDYAASLPAIATIQAFDVIGRRLI